MLNVILGVIKFIKNFLLKYIVYYVFNDFFYKKKLKIEIVDKEIFINIIFLNN